MRPHESGLSPTALARLHWQQGGELADNPYPACSEQREAYNWEMHRLQVQEFKQEMTSHE
jgi:hypothetical protein